MTDEQLQRIHDIEYSCDSREELAERIVGLEDELAKWERLAAGIELPEYPITQFQPKDLERENAKLHELVDYMTPIAWYAASERERDRMRELGLRGEDA